jgi:SAM-dependent methyltransferase
MSMDTSRLDRSGWSSFDQDLFLNEPGRLSRDEGEFFLGLLRDFCRGKRVLELCCGSGKLAIRLAREGYCVTGIDLSESMLRVARERAAREDDGVCERLHLVQADICEFDLAQEFDFIILEDDGFCYLLTQDEQLACLHRVQAHLAPAGLFFLSLPTPQSELADTTPYEYDPIRQIRTVHCEWTSLDEQGHPRIVRQGVERRRLIYPCELDLLLKIAGLETVHRWGDYRRTPFSDPCRQEYVCLMTRA